ncbi:MAG: uridine kinase [Gammaproteobacteria bacterium GWE2_42_36]|nr:MAG: uridine kinase [Gammaproteobacteria bacterium GWE2_42_36]HCU05420.1 uridine kinase [Coxiellaceae bacterium]
MNNKKIIIIGIAGSSASGKTLLSNTIVKELGSKRVAVLSEDSYYKPLSHLSFEERSKVNFDHPDSLDHALLHEHLMALQAGQSIEVPVYDFETHSRSKETRFVGNHTIIVLEGILLFTDIKLREQMDIRIFMDTPLDICFIRRLSRDMMERGRSLDNIIGQYLATVRPMYFQFIEPSRRHADIIVPNGGENRIAIDVIKAKMRELLGKDDDTKQ